MSLRVLLVTAHYPPATESGARRPWELVRAMQLAGMSPTVLTFGEEPGTRIGDNGETIVTCRVPDIALERSGAQSPNAQPRSLLGSARRRLRFALPGLAAQWGAFRGYPDLYRDGVAEIAKAGATIHTDVVYSTAPPISIHLVACRLSQELAVPWIAEFRDPWADPSTGRPAFEGTIMARRARRDRQRLVRIPHVTVGVSEGIGAWLRDEGARSVIVSRNGIPDRLLVAPSPERVDPSRIGYFGSLYLDRSPEPFLDALVGLRAKGHPAARKAQLDLVGDVNSFGERSVRDLLSSRTLESIASLEPRKPHDAVVAHMRRCGLLLLLAQRQPRQIPNKLYEYLAARRPILAWVDAEGETAALLRTVNGHFLVTEHETPAQTEAIVAAALAASPDWSPYSEKTLTDLATRNQLTKVVEATRQVASR